MNEMVKVPMASGGTLFTRGGLDAPDNRGESMVQRHLEKLRKEKETNALVAVRDAFPDLGPAVCIVACEASEWEVDAAVRLLGAFHTVKANQLDNLIQERKGRHEARGDTEVDAAAPIPESNPVSANSSGGESSQSESDREDRKSKKRRREKESSSKGSKRKKSSKDKKERSRKDKNRGKEKKTKRSRDEKKSDQIEEPEVAEPTGYGAHGILRDGDSNAKRAEFQAWAIDTKNVDIETLMKSDEKELWSTYVEDFNTSTLPHRKYYNLEFYEQERAAKARRTGKPVNTERTAFDDEAELKRERKAKRAAEEQERFRDAYNALKYTDHGKRDDMREQELMKLQMQQAYRVGDHATAAQLKRKLKPDEPKFGIDGKPIR